MTGSGSDRRARALLWLGVVAGVGAAAVGLVQSGPAGRSLPDGLVAIVNGEPVTEEAFAQLEAAVTGERRGAPLDEAQRQRLLDRLVDEELLLQRGIELGLPRHEPSARRAIVSAVVATITSDAEAAEPDEATLRRFHAETADRFQRPGRLLVRTIFASTHGRPEAEAFERAQQAARRARAGEDFDAVAAAVGDPQTASLPAGALPIETLREYLGPSPAKAALALRPGAVSDPVRGGTGYYVLRLESRSDGELIPFEEIRDDVRSEWLRTEGERALADYLQQLRKDGEVQVRLPTPKASPARP